MRHPDETGVCVESTIEMGMACNTCGMFSHEEDAPCGACAGRPERLDALRWALRTTLTLGPQDPRLKAARVNPETDWEEGEWRVDALRALADDYEATRMIQEVIRNGWKNRPILPKGIGVFTNEAVDAIERRANPMVGDRIGYEWGSLWPEPNRSEWIQQSLPMDDTLPDPIFLPTKALPLFTHLLLGIMAGPEAMIDAFASARQMCGGPWPTIVSSPRLSDGRDWRVAIIDGVMDHVVSPVGAVRYAAKVAKVQRCKWRVCSGCMGKALDGGDWCDECLALHWAGNCLAKLGQRKATHALIRGKWRPNTSLPEPTALAALRTLDIMNSDNDWVGRRLARMLGDREWCGVKSAKAASELVTRVENDYLVHVMLDLERHETPGTIALTGKQVRRLLPILVTIPWFLPDVRGQMSMAIEQVCQG